MGEPDMSEWFQSFDCESVPLAPGTPAAPRPSHRPRDGGEPPTFFDGVLVGFEDESVPLAPGTPAAPRPSHRPRDGSAEAFARELADRVLEYVRTRSTDLTAEQLATLIQQLLARRSV